MTQRFQLVHRSAGAVVTPTGVTTAAGVQPAAAARRSPLEALIGALPAEDIGASLIGGHVEVARALMATSRGLRDGMSHRLVLGDREFRQRDFLRRLPFTLPDTAAELIGPRNGRRVCAAALIALINGGVAGKLDQARFECVLAVLIKLNHRQTLSLNDFASIGIPVKDRIRMTLLADVWSIVGLVNGVLQFEDVEDIDFNGIALPDQFWLRMFPGPAGRELPPATEVDLAQIGCYARSEGQAIDPKRFDLNVYRMSKDYEGRLHYLAAVVSARVAGRHFDGFKAPASDELANVAVCKLVNGERFANRQDPVTEARRGERDCSAVCRIV